MLSLYFIARYHIVCVSETAKKRSVRLILRQRYIKLLNRPQFAQHMSLSQQKPDSTALTLRLLQVCVHIKRKRKTESGKTKIIIRKLKTKKTSVIYGYRVCPLKPAIASN